MNTPTRRGFGLHLLAASAVAAAVPSLARAQSRGDDGRDDDNEWRTGRVYTATNAIAGNEVLVFAPARDGGLAMIQRVATQGTGTGAGLGSQGSVTTSGDGRWLFVVNAGSSTVSTYSLRGRKPELSSVVNAGGLMPTSVAEHDDLVYVMNAGGNGNVAGFRNVRGVLHPLGDGLRGLSAAGGTNPGQVGFNEDGDVLVVTERLTSRISTWRVRRDGTLGPIVVTPSSGTTPFGFAFDQRDHLLVSEATGAPGGSAASSYRLDERAPATPVLISASVPTNQRAACWLVVAPSGRLAYTANAGSSSISSFRVDRYGRLELAQAAAGSSNDGGATDMAMAAGGRLLYLLAARGQQVIAFRPYRDGSLELAGTGNGLPAGCVGLAAD